PAGEITYVQTGGNEQAAGTAAGAAAIVGATLPVIGSILTRISGATTGVGEDVVKRAATNPTPELLAAMRGEITEADILANTRQAVAELTAERANNYTARLRNLPQNIQLDLRPTQMEASRALQDFGITGVRNPQTGKIALDFQYSPIVNEGA